MGRTVQEKVEQVLRAAFFQDPPYEGRCSKVVLTELVRGADPIRLFSWPVPREPQPNTVGELAMQIAEYAQEHADAFGTGQRKLFAVDCLFGPSDIKLMSTPPFAIRGAMEETALAIRNPDGSIGSVVVDPATGAPIGAGSEPDSALPPMPAYGKNQYANVSLPGMVTDLHRLLIASTAQTFNSLQQTNKDLRTQLQQADARRLEMFEMLEELADRRLERELAIEDRHRKAAREEKAFEAFTPLLYLLANKILGKGILPSQHPAMLALREVFAQLTPTQAQKLLSIFEPAQGAVLLDIYAQFAKEEDEKKQIEAEKAQKKEQENGQNPPASPNGSPTPRRLN